MLIIEGESKTKSKELSSKYNQRLTMNHSRSNRTCTMQGCTSYMNTRDLTINKSEDNNEAVDQSSTFAEQEILIPHNVKHEIQVSEGGEADLHKHFNSCEKNPGHKKFVPVNDFNINHLPKGHHDNDIVELIKATADVTVKLAVKMTSTARPEFWPDTQEPYASYEMRGSDVMRAGTGTVRLVEQWTDEDKKGTCQCRRCQHSDTPSKVWGEVSMYTATHVVFDDIEARHTTCRLFYDRQDSPLVTLDGWTMVEAHIKDDWCQLTCVTCDVDLLDKLDKMANHWFNLWERKKIKFNSPRDEDKLSFMVSHPHGISKQVSLGQWINRYVVSKYVVGKCRTKYTYSTCTCPGSSGAYVYSRVYNDGWLYYVRHEHTGVDSKGNNISGAGWDPQ